MERASNVSKNGSKGFVRWARKRKGLLAVIALVIVGGAVWGITRQGDATPTTSYTTTAAENGTISVTVSGSGNLEPVTTTDVYPDTGGEVASIEVTEGDTVKKGQVLYTVSNTDAEATLSKAYSSYVLAKQGVQRAGYSLTAAQQTLDSLDEGTTTSADGKTTTVTATDVDLGEQNVTIAELGVTAANADLKSALLTYEDAKEADGELSVTAPAAGVIESLNIEVGDTVSTSSGSSSSSSSGSSSGTSNDTGAATTSTSTSAPLTMISQTYCVSLAVNEVDIAKIKVDQKASVTLDALPEDEFSGTVTEIGSDATIASGVVTYPVYVTFDVKDSRFRTGLSAAADVVTTVQQDVLLVPNAAIKSTTDGAAYVQVLAGGATTPTNVTVETGVSSSTQTVITSGITAGTKAVTATSTSDASSSSSSASSSSSGSLLGGISSGSGPGSGGGPGGN